MDADQRLRQVANHLDQLAVSVRRATDDGRPLTYDLTVDLLEILDALSIYATTDVAEPGSYRVFDGLRVVK